jgi:hypothetical protein
VVRACSLYFAKGKNFGADNLVNIAGAALSVSHFVCGVHGIPLQGLPVLHVCMVGSACCCYGLVLAHLQMLLALHVCMSGLHVMPWTLPWPRSRAVHVVHAAGLWRGRLCACDCAGAAALHQVWLTVTPASLLELATTHILCCSVRRSAKLISHRCRFSARMPPQHPAWG